MAGPSTKWKGALSRSGSAEAWAPRALLLITLFTAAAVIAGACSGNNSGLPGPGDGAATGGGSDGGTGGPCAEGEVVECHLTVGEHAGVLTCLDGIRRCEGGKFGACSGTTTMRRSPLGPGPRGGGEGANPRPLANSEPSNGGLCATNPCDPSCQSFEETPDGGPIVLEGDGTSYTWSVGDINELPETVARQGTHQPCTTAEDCQFDQYCSAPSVGACAHDLCADGGALLSTCNACVTKVCEENPACCVQTAVPGDCGHDACEVTGGAADNMNTTCGDPCIAAICEADPRCCTPLCDVFNPDVNPHLACEAAVGPGSMCMIGNKCSKIGSVCPPELAPDGSNACTGSWTQNCVDLVATQCPGKTCVSSSGWTDTCVGLAETMCGASCEAGGMCAHDKCYTGPRLAESCDPCVALVCEQEPSCCALNGEWTQRCVDLVETACGETCPQRGLCKSYLPNETNPDCGGVDLTLGVPCGGTIPVCNRGNTQAPAGIEIRAYSAGAGQLPSSAPGRILDACNPTGGTVACTTALPIDPGECISVADCAGLTDGMELFVNPPGPDTVVECQCGNNGSVYQSAECQSPGCIATASISLVRPVTLFVSLDKSLSMVRNNANEDVSDDRWEPATDALKDFFADPESAGLGVALRFWPHNNPGNCNGDPYCQYDGCANPIVPFDGTTAQRLTADLAPIDQQEVRLISAIDSVEPPAGGTPMYGALHGATTWAINYKNAHPEEEVAVVLVTDGIPTDCVTAPNTIADLARDAFQDHGVRVHMVGFGGSNPEVINLIADAGGGRAFNLSAGGTLRGSLRNALVSIRGEVLPCNVTVPVAGASDPNAVSVIHVNNAGTETLLTRVPDAASCGAGTTGWYFPDATYSSVRLCPGTCESVREQAGGKVRAIVPCVETGLSAIDTSWERYHAVCPPGTKAQWGYLRYRTSTPGDSRIEFFVRSADDPEALEAATVRQAATASATPTDTQICDETSTPTCAVDLFEVLGELPDARRDYLELRMRLHPTSASEGGAQVQDWEITYSCPDSE
ncbi:keratin associated protein 5-1 [Sorangium cellulosum]|uniref:Keratin associated protein 5-1 n=1 Tax=Sorangium cellulosum TaxID=56 RepID=A0A4P2Q2M0_SORCE|nr:VWA domain-containing protein [Sorangium cellulosum]AUX23557.1 keratin associated protein 5-1 [Sorangium cellulosum]